MRERGRASQLGRPVEGRRLIVRVVLFALVIGGIPAMAEGVLYKDTFDAHPVGSWVSGLYPEIGSPWITTPGTGVIGSDNEPDHNVTLDSPPGNGAPFVSARFESTEPVVTVDFDWTFPSDVNPVMQDPEVVVYSKIESGFSLGTLVGIRSGGFYATGAGSLLAKGDITGSYHVTMTHYMDTNQLRVMIDDLATPESPDGSSFVTLSHDLLYVYSVDFEMPRGGLGTMIVDNVVVTQVPEPHVAAFVLGTLCVALRRRAR